MKPRSTKTRNRRKEGEVRSFDGLSLLPDSILAHIFSFLDTKTVVRTSVLSKRYKLLWTLTQSLDFKFPDGIRSYEKNKAILPSHGWSVSNSFTSYVNRVLQLREHSDLTSLKLSLHDFPSHRFVENCIDYAAKHKVQNLKIRYFDKYRPIALPELLMTSPSLISLKLNASVSKCIDLPKSVHLPSLKELRLQGFEFSSLNFDGELFRGSPSLEKLVLRKCCIKPGDKLRTLDVNCPKLVSLEVINWRSPWKCFDEHTIAVNAPKLAFFKLQGHIARFELVEKLSCLNEGCIMLCYPSACATADGERRRKSAEACVGLLRQLRSAKFLSISLKAAEIVSCLPQIRLQTDFVFENLKNVKIIVDSEYAEGTIPTDKAADEQFVGVSTDCFPFRASEEPKLSRECKSKHKKRSSPLMIPLHFLQFLMESSPSETLFTVELPKESSSD